MTVDEPLRTSALEANTAPDEFSTVGKFLRLGVAP